MLEFRPPQLEDRERVCDIIGKTGLLGSDISFANLFLLRHKYHLQICFEQGFLLRHYDGDYGRKGFTFPLGEGNPENVLEKLEEYAASENMRFDFIFLTAEQKESLEELYPGRFTFDTEDGNSDYIYFSKNLAELNGSIYHKHKNHVKRFFRTFPDAGTIRLNDANRQDVLAVEIQWLEEHGNGEAYLSEYSAIREALENPDALGIGGLILYVKEVPCAFSVFSEINENVCDIHFEKAVADCAQYGGYSVICMAAAEELRRYRYLNREEDLGIEGLRRSKMSYHPDIIYRKYKAVSQTE